MCFFYILISIIYKIIKNNRIKEICKKKKLKFKIKNKNSVIKKVD